MVLRTDSHEYRNIHMGRSEPRRWRIKPAHTSIIAWHVLALAYYCCTSIALCSAESTKDNVRLMDLTHTFDKRTIYWVTAKKLNLTTTAFNTTTDNGKNIWYQTDELEAGTHGGTHMDAPCHFAFGKWCIGDIPVERLVVPAVTVDVSRYVSGNSNVHFSLNHLTEWEAKHGRIPHGSVLLVRTGWSRFWPDVLNYTGTSERNASLLKFPSIEPEVAEWLVENRDVVGVGIDVMSTDIPGSNREVHVALANKNIYGLENVKLPGDLPPTGLKLYVMPMKLKGASGAPCRVVAEYLSNAVPSNSASLTLSVLLTLLWTLKFLRF